MNRFTADAKLNCEYCTQQAKQSYELNKSLFSPKINNIEEKH